MLTKDLEEIKPGYELPNLTKTVSEDEIFMYAMASSDFNRIHIDSEFARKADLKGVIAHGMLLLGLVESLHQRFFGDLWSDGGSLDIKFKRPVYPQDTINIKSTVLSVDDTQNKKTIVCAVIANNGYDTILTGFAKLTIKQEASQNQ